MIDRWMDGWVDGEEEKGATPPMPLLFPRSLGCQKASSKVVEQVVDLPGPALVSQLSCDGDSCSSPIAHNRLILVTWKKDGVQKILLCPPASYIQILSLQQTNGMTLGKLVP